MPALDPLELLDEVVAAIPGGEDRPQQREMVAAVQEAVRTGRHLAVQGPTGVGKSIAYLLPAIAAAAEGTRTVVVTSSKALQDQLGGTDLPFLADALDADFRAAVLKGRSNYLCVAAAEQTRVQLAEGTQTSLDLVGSATDTGLRSDGAFREQVERLLEWAETTATGELAELTEAPDDGAWAAVSVGPGECVGAAKCARAPECFSELARERAASADVVVVNAHLYAAHLQSGRALLSDHDLLVIDEAHEFEDALVDALGVRMTGWRLRNLARVHDGVVAAAPEVAVALGAAADALDSALDVAHAAAVEDHGSGRLRGELPAEVGAALGDAALATDRALTSIRGAIRGAGERASADARHRAERAIRTVEGVSEAVRTLQGEVEPGQVRWITETGGGRHALQLTRIDVADTLRELAWEDGPTVVLCSATLDPGTAERLGLDARFLAVDSPFDFRRNGLLYVPRLPRPADERWPDAVADEITHVLERFGGRTLALFTSHRMLRRTTAEVRRRLPHLTILAQGDAPNPVLQQQFLAEEHTSLFATASFWTGISSPGSTCSAVVVDKIPFPVPTDPIVEARCDLVGDARAFAEVSVPAAGMQLAQGVGRLIRTTTDRGAVAVLDPRLAEARYRGRILDLLPRMRRTRDRVDLDDFAASLELPSPP